MPIRIRGAFRNDKNGGIVPEAALRNRLHDHAESFIVIGNHGGCGLFITQFQQQQGRHGTGFFEIFQRGDKGLSAGRIRVVRVASGK